MSSNLEKATNYIGLKYGQTISEWAKEHDISVSSARNTFSGIKPIRKATFKIYNIDKELFNLLPLNAKSLIS